MKGNVIVPRIFSLTFFFKWENQFMDDLIGFQRESWRLSQEVNFFSIKLSLINPWVQKKILYKENEWIACSMKVILDSDSELIFFDQEKVPQEVTIGFQTSSWKIKFIWRLGTFSFSCLELMFENESGYDSVTDTGSFQMTTVESCSISQIFFH